MKGWIIIKSSRDSFNRFSYDGPTWDRARIREERQAVYDDKELALKHAKILSQYNAVGFQIHPVLVIREI